MIFKTFQSDLDGISNKLGFSKRSFAEWGKQVSTSFKESEGVISGFKNAIKTAFTVPVEKDDSWIKNKSGEIVNKDNIDSLIPELTEKRASNLAQSIREQSIAVGDAKKGWDDYFTKLKSSGQGYVVDLIKNTDDLSKLTGEDLVKANQKARESAIAHNAALKQQTLGAKAAAVGMKALSTIGNMAAGMIISWGVSKIFEGIDYLVNYEEKQKEAFENAKSATEECVNSVKKLKSEMSDTSSETSKLVSEFAKLVQGVDPLTNENKSLSTESYERFLEVNNQLAELFPSLTKKL